MGFSTISLQVEAITPAKAQSLLECNYAHNRKRRENWVAFLANEMREGRFLSTAEIHIMYRNGEPVLVNGQHTCAAIVSYGKPVRVTVRKTSTTEAGQIAMTYAFGHDNGIRRTFTDGLGAYNLGEQLGLGPTRIQELSSALRHIRDGFYSKGGNRTVAAPLPEIIERMETWAPFYRLFLSEITAESSNGSFKNLCFKRGALSVILTTYRFDLDTARLFWRGVINPGGLMGDDPRYRARLVLEASLNEKGRYSAALSRALARCWRGYKNKETMRETPSTRKGVNAAAPIVILGTPFKGTQPPPPWWPEDSSLIGSPLEVSGH